MPRTILRLMLCLLPLLAVLQPPVAIAAERRGPLVLAAASLQDVMTAAADAWQGAGHPRPTLSFAGTSALARQIKAGAPADLFLSADQEWMDDVEAAGALLRGTRSNVAGNRLVLIAPADRPVRLAVRRGMPIARALGKSRLAMANPDSVPAGKYGKAALGALGVWPSVADRIVRTQDVRATLALVERGEVALGIVYATDALASRKVRVVGTFPGGSHPPILYALARLRTSTNPDAEGFRRFLLSRQGRAILVRQGFTAP